MPKYLRLEDMSIVTHQAKETGGAPFQCPMLTSTNYTTWAIKMEAIMDPHGLWESIEPQAGVDVDEKKNKSARAFIFQAVPEDVLLQVANKKKASEIWESLKLRYLGADRVQKARLHTLKSDFEALRMKEEDSIDDFAGRLSGMVSKYSSLGATLEDSVLVRKLLDSVPDKYLQLVASIEQYSDIDKMPFEEAIGRLKAYEDRLRLQKINTTSEAGLLLSRTEGQASQKASGGSTSTGGRGRGSFQHDRGGRSGGRGRGSSRGRGSGRGRGGRGSFWTPRDSSNSHQRFRDKKHIKCFNCDQYGHYALECSSPLRERTVEANLAQAQEDEPALLFTVCDEKENTMVLLNEDKVFLSHHDKKVENWEKTWYLDNGASNHMTGVRELFATLDNKIMGQVRFGDESKVPIKGRGSIILEGKTGEQRIISEAYYIPALRSNILSLGQLTEEGYKISMADEYLRMRDENNRLIMKVKRSVNNRLYKVVLQTPQPTCLAVKLDDDSWLWHTRMGHVNFRVLEHMVDREMVRGIPKIRHPKQVCVGCLAAKQTRRPFPKEAQYRVGSPLELLHADLCGPITP